MKQKKGIFVSNLARAILQLKCTRCARTITSHTGLELDAGMFLVCATCYIETATPEMIQEQLDCIAIETAARERKHQK
jgi:hypothetical protein